MKEELEYIPKFEDYLVSNYGYVYNAKLRKIIATSVNEQKVAFVSLSRDGKQHHKALGLLVARTFIPRPHDHFNTPIHLDGDRNNCDVRNLMWRPRWFSAKFHRQFEQTYFNEGTDRVEVIETGEQFNSVREACVKYGLLAIDVMNSAHLPEDRKVFPIWQSFRMVA